MNAIDVEEFSVRAETTVQFTSHALLQQRLTRIAVNLNNYDNFPSIREKMEKFKILPEIFSIRGFTSNTVPPPPQLKFTRGSKNRSIFHDFFLLVLSSPLSRSNLLVEQPLLRSLPRNSFSFKLKV